MTTNPEEIAKGLSEARCHESWHGCPNARQAVDPVHYIVMRCKITGEHPDYCVRSHLEKTNDR